LEVHVVTGKRLPGLALVVPLVLVGVLPGCGGSKRAPAVTTEAARPAPAPARPMEPAMPEQPVDPGPDVQPMTDERALAEDFSVSDPSGEGGPLEDVHFEYDQARLSDQARAIVERHALWLQNHRAAKVVVEGHCDERGTTDYNLALGEQRARVVRDYLVSLGVAADRVTAVSYGKERPLDTGSNEAAWARNRRAHFNVRR
jgi:peptidoglycan-associated lipoprotein